jgi:uncharacterized repeat protein (TIGR03847 family)
MAPLSRATHSGELSLSSRVTKTSKCYFLTKISVSPRPEPFIAQVQKYNYVAKIYNISQGGNEVGTEKRYEYDEVALLSPFVVGVPGKRTFFLAMGEKNNWLRVWLEKEHLQALALGIEQLLFNLSQEHTSVPQQAEGPPLSDDIPLGLPSAELDIVQMTLGYVQGKATLELLVQRSGSPEENPSEVYCQATLAQLKRLRRQAMSICAAGRPLCQLCGGPIDPTGHICPRQN